MFAREVSVWYLSSNKIQCKTQFTHNILAHNIEIKKYCNKKIKRHFSSNIFISQSNILEKKIYFYQNIFFIFYRNIVYKNIECDVDLNETNPILFQLMDFYSASGIPILWCCFFQTIAIGWIFGTTKFAACIEQVSISASFYTQLFCT